MKIIQALPVVALASLFTVLIPNSAMAISDYQSGYDDGYAAAQASKGVYAIGDACEQRSTQYCNGFKAGYTTDFFALYQNLPTTLFMLCMRLDLMLSLSIHISTITRIRHSLLFTDHSLYTLIHISLDQYIIIRQSSYNHTRSFRDTLVSLVQV